MPKAVWASICARVGVRLLRGGDGYLADLFPDVGRVGAGLGRVGRWDGGIGAPMALLVVQGTESLER